jgi:hypothetical protein
MLGSLGIQQCFVKGQLQNAGNQMFQQLLLIGLKDIIDFFLFVPTGTSILAQAAIVLP